MSSTDALPRIMRSLLLALLALALIPAAAQADTVFAPTDAPGGDSITDSPLEVGMKFQANADGYITALRFYKQPSNTGAHIGHLWSSTGQQLAEVTFTNETDSGWQQQDLSEAVPVTAGTSYVVSYYSPAGRFAFSPGYFTAPVGSGALQAPAAGNGVFKYGSAPAFPDETWNSTNYWVDANFAATPPSDTRPPQVSATTPDDGSNDVAPATTPTVTFDEAMKASTITASTITVRNEQNAAVAASVAYDAATRKATITPSASLPLGHTYTVTVAGGSGGVTDVAGNPLAASRSWSFSTSALCPCTVFAPTDGPLGDANSDSPIEVGMKFRSTEDGWITALRFYKQPSNTGTHVGHLWAADGTKLAEVTFSNETASGWQQAQLPVPVQITKNTTYITSYYAAAGRFAFSSGYFSSGTTRTPLQAPSDFAAGGNGVYKYGPSAFPDSSFGATNYWVDAAFERNAPADARAPQTTDLSPAANATRVPLDSKLVVRFDEPLDRMTVNTGSILLKDDAGNPVPGVVTYDDATYTATLTPSAPLQLGKTYTATLKSGNAGVTDLAGNQLPADKSWSFSTAPQCPCTIFKSTDGPASTTANRDQPLEIGVRFTSAEDGYITSLRFYKQANNVGTHVGHLWGPDGTLLASVPFANETASGWESAELPNPVAITKGTVYVASYYSPGGFFPFDQGYFTSGHDGGMLSALPAGQGGNGVYHYGASAFPDTSFNATNYWVDASFDRTVPPDTRGPDITETTPSASESDVARDTAVTATFDEQLTPSSISGTTFTLKDASGNAVPATVTYNAQTRTAKLQPSAPLAYQGVYTATLKGGTGGVADASGNTLSANKNWTFTVIGQAPTEGPGGPILVQTDASDPFDSYYAEILRGEGLNQFDVSSAPLTSTSLAGHTTVILADSTLSDADVATLTTWVQGGGNLIAMRPDKKLASLLGLTDTGGTLANGYMKADPNSAAGAGIDPQTLQYHGTADLYTLNGASAVAGLYSDATTVTPNPAVSLRDVGASGGQVAAFTYDLARSVVYTRQGNPAWAGQKRDGWAPLSIRPDDLFYGAKAGDVQPDWVDPNRFDVPQADEQQRLFANLITQMNLDKAPLPRFWYLPSGDKAAIVLTGDDHGTGHTTEYFNRLKAASPAGCSVADWQCVRATSYVYPETPLTQAQASSFVNDGFEIALHVNTGCLDYTPASIEDTYTSQLGAFAATWPDLPKPVTNRTHCIVWSDWASQAKTERHHGIRFDTNYYYKGPPEWVKKPGLMTGSGFPQRFADSDGSMIDVYQAMTQVSDEEETVLPTATQVHTLLDNALGPKNYWGAFTVILHTDNGDHAQLNQLVGDAQNRGVPVVSSAQMLQWLDGRNGSSFGNVAYSGGQLTFTLSAQASAHDLEAMLPARSASGPLSKLKRNGVAISWTRKTIKGVDYVMFDAASGSYTATYANDTTAPEITNVSATADAEGHATVKWTTDEPSTSLVQYGRTTSLGYEKEQTAEVTDHSVELTGLVPATTYRFNVSSTDTAGNTGTSPATPGSFSTPASALVDSRRAEFAAGTTSGTWAGDTLVGPDGEVQLQPTVGDEFDGPGLSGQWVATPWQLGGTTNLVGGTLVADTAVVHTPGYYAGPRTLEFSATFQAVNDQAVGLGNDLSDFPYAIFTSGMPGETPGVYAQSGGGPGNEIETPLPNVSLYVPHRFRIEWNPTVIRYYVDGTLVATHSVAIENELRPVLSDYGLFGASVKVDWMRMSTYPTSGTFTSRPLDSGPGANDWQTLSWQTATLPAGTSVSFETRSGGARTPDNKWSAWQPLGLGNAIASPNARYLQYRATLQGPGTATPTLQKVQATYGAGTDRAPNTGTVSLAPTAPKTNQVVTATAGSFTDPDGDPVTLHYDWFRNGTQIPGASASSLNLALAGNGDRGDKIRVEVYGTDNKGAASDIASAKVTVADTAPTAGTVTTKPVPAATKDILRALPSGFADIDADTLTYQYQWLINGTPVAGATSATFNVSGLVKLNDRVDVDVKAIDGFGGTSPTVRGGQVITTTNSTPVDGTVAITPASPKTNQLVAVQTSGFSDADGDALTYHYVWSRNGTAIPGATASTLDLSLAGNGDRGDTIKVNVNVTDPAGHASDGVSATATVATTDPTAGTVSIRPTAPAADDTVSAVPTGYADIDGDALSYQYQWFRNGAAISGATGRSLNLATVPGVAAGDVLKVQARALDGYGGTSPFAEGTTAVAAGNGHPVASFGFEEASGNVATDQWGGNDGTITGATRTNSGRFGRALSFENDGDLVTVPEDTSLHLGSGMTLEAWVKPTATTNWRSVIFKEADGGLAYGLYANSDQDVPHVHIGNQGDFGVDGPSELDPNKWTHLAATFDGNILKLYQDGVQVGSKAISGELSDAPGPLTIGGNNIWGEHFRGTIDEVRVYNRALTREDVGADMTAPVTPGTPAPPADNNPDAIGSFSKPVDYPITPVHLALLSDGRVAMWDGFEAALNSEHTWDPWSGQFDAIPTGRNLFCAGHVTLPDGRLLVAGGHVQAYEGTKDTNLFNPQTNTWFRGADMQNARWYPTSTTLPDGRVFTISGDNITLGPNPDPNTPVPLINYSDTLPEIYNPTTNAWTSMPSASRRMPLYPFMFVLPNGKLFDAGPDKVTRTLDLGTGQWTTVGNSPIDGQSAVMYRPGKILKSGTWSDPEFPDRDASNKTAMIDMTAASPAWTEAAPMKYRRSFNTLTVLPDGKVLTTGGQTKTDGVDETTGVLPAEMWDPNTNTWTTMASSHRPRLYHSSAVLLPDGRVLLAGGGAYGTAHNEKSGELYSPPYMFKGPRPTITDGPAAVHYGQSFTIDTPDASRISKVTLVHMGTVTHNFDMDQRYMELNATAGSGQLTVSGPQNANVAPPGWYMVFLVDSNGVPSYAQIVMVDAAGDTQAPTAPSTLSATAVTDGANLSWSASSDNVGVTGYRVYRSTTSGFTPGPSNRIATVKSGTTYQDRGVAAGTYRYRVKAVDKAGNLSAASPQATATVTGDTTSPSVSLSAPAAGASLSNTVTVSATAADNVGVQSVQFKLDGQDLGAADTASPYSISWDTKTATDGPHSLTAVARDASGNTKTSASVAVEVHNTGLVAAYGFEEASGATAVDALGHRNGTIVGGATRTGSGRFGQALTLDGASGMVTVPDDSTLRLSSGMTLEAWVRPSALTSASSILTKDQTGGFSYSLLANTAANVPSANVFTTSALAAAGPASLALGTWTHVAETWDGANVKLFIDGAEVASQPTTGSLAANAGQLKIGGSSAAGQFFNGLVDEVRVFSRARTASEIGADMNTPVSP